MNRDSEDLPRLTVRLLARAGTGCPRRVYREHSGNPAMGGANRRYRVRSQIEEDARLAHTSMTGARAEHFHPQTSDLSAEERAVYELAARWYIALFGDRPARVDDLATEPMETRAPRTGIRLVGGAGLAVVDPHGVRELRMLSIGDRSTDEILDSVSVRFAVLRRPHWSRAGALRIVRADLHGGWLVEADADGPELFEASRIWMVDQLALIRSHMDSAAPRAGTECGTCAFIPGCRAFP